MTRMTINIHARKVHDQKRSHIKDERAKNLRLLRKASIDAERKAMREWFRTMDYWL